MYLKDKTIFFAMQLNLYRIPHQRQLFKLTTVKQGSTEASNYNKQVKLQKGMMIWGLMRKITLECTLECE